MLSAVCTLLYLHSDRNKSICYNFLRIELMGGMFIIATNAVGSRCFCCSISVATAACNYMAISDFVLQYSRQLKLA